MVPDVKDLKSTKNVHPWTKAIWDKSAEHLAEGQAEVTGGIGPPPLELEARRQQLLGDSTPAELGADLSADLLALSQLHGQVDGGHRHRLGPIGAQPHLDPLLVRVPTRHVLEGRKIEVGAQ